MTPGRLDPDAADRPPRRRGRHLAAPASRLGRVIAIGYCESPAARRRPPSPLAALRGPVSMRRSPRGGFHCLTFRGGFRALDPGCRDCRWATFQGCLAVEGRLVSRDARARLTPRPVAAAAMGRAPAVPAPGAACGASIARMWLQAARGWLTQ